MRRGVEREIEEIQPVLLTDRDYRQYKMSLSRSDIRKQSGVMKEVMRTALSVNTKEIVTESGEVIEVSLLDEWGIRLSKELLEKGTIDDYIKVQQMIEGETKGSGNVNNTQVNIFIPMSND